MFKIWPKSKQVGAAYHRCRCPCLSILLAMFGYFSAHWSLSEPQPLISADGVDASLGWGSLQNQLMALWWWGMQCRGDLQQLRYDKELRQAREDEQWERLAHRVHIATYCTLKKGVSKILKYWNWQMDYLWWPTRREEERWKGLKFCGRINP